MAHPQLALTVQPQHVEPDGWADDWHEYLTGPRLTVRQGAGSLRLLDLFSGVGGLALGFIRAAAEHRSTVDSIGAVDLDVGALGVYRANLATRHARDASVAGIVDFQVRGSGSTARFFYRPELIGNAADEFAGAVDVVLAGPPCQGHSSLNNNTRHDDPRNRLYLTVPAVAVAAGASTVIIENVPGVVNSKGALVQTAIGLLESEGYAVTTATLAAHALGWPQTRKRFFLVARRDRDPVPLAEIQADLRREPLPLSWAIEDLIDTEAADDAMHSVAEISAENASRIAWLFANDAYNTPNHLRPDCHKDGTTYGAVYGRMRWDKPAPTLTTGFLTPGRGRFIHPKRQRTLTPHEAARLQGFPDWFTFRVGDEDPARKSLGAWIGNAVPTILGFAAGLSAIGG